MIACENLKNSETIEDFDYLEADEAFPDFPDDENLDDLGFSDEPLEEAENTYLSMKDTDNIDKQVVERYSSFAKRVIDPLQERTQKLEEDTKLSAEVQEQNEENRNIMEKNNIAVNDLVKRILLLLTPEKIEENTKKQVEIAKEELGKFLNDGYADAFMIIKTQVENFVDKIIEDKFVEAEKRLDDKLEACRLAEERLDKKEEELNRKQEEIQQKNDEFDQKVEEFYRQQESKQVEIEEMVASLVEQNNDLRDNLENEKKEKLQLKIVIEEQNKTIAAQTEQSEKLIITIKEENDQKAQILREKEELFDVIQKKDERRTKEIQEQNEEIKKLRQAVAEREKNIKFSNSILIYFISAVFIVWGLIGISTTPEIQSWLKSFVNNVSWSSIGVGVLVFGFKFYKDVTK